MRIAIDARQAQSERVGMGVYVGGLIRALIAGYPEHELLLLTAGALAPLDLPNASNVQILPVAPTFQEYFARDRWEQWDLVRVLAELGVDVYHSPNYTLPFLRRAPCAMVVTLYDASLFMMPTVYRARHSVRVRFIIRRELPRANGVIFGSRHAQSEFQQLFGTTLPSVQRSIYMGVPEDILAPFETSAEPVLDSVLDRYGIKTPYAIAVGSVHPRKNYVRLIDAFTEPRLAGCNLVIAGGVAWKADGVREAISAHCLHDRVTLTGFVETADLKTLIRGATMMVFPSLYEGFGIPPLEAFALGVPVCASSASSIPEVVGDAAILFDPLSPRDMADAMARLFHDTALRRVLVEKGRAQIKKFNWQQCAREHIDVYTQAREHYRDHLA